MAEIWGIAVAAGAGILGGVISASGAESAASTQAGAAENAQQISENEFNQITAQEQPYMQGGYGALSQLDYLLGVSPQTATGGAVGTGAPYSSALSASPSASGTPSGFPTNPTTGAAAPPGQQWIAAPGFSAKGGTATTYALAPISSPSTQYSDGVPNPNPLTAGGGLGANGVPLSVGGSTAQPTSAQGGSTAGSYGSLLTPFTASNFQQLSPAYNFQLTQGQQGVLNGDASGAGALSGSAQKDLISYNQNMANTSFNNAFNQYQTQQGNIYSRLAGVAQLGQTSAANTGQQGTALAGQAAQSATNVGTALAGGTVGAANAYSGAISNASYLPYLYNSSGSGGGGSSSSQDFSEMA